MFCSKCGNQLAEGAKFCSVCGTRTASTGLESQPERPLHDRTQYEEPAQRNARRHPSLNLDWGEEEVRPTKSSSDFSFDWSSVVEERGARKRTPLKVRSPWDNYSENDDEVSSPSYGTSSYSSTSSYREPRRSMSLEDELFGREEALNDRGRTMNFIDVLKQERDENERAKYQSLRYREPEKKPMPPTAHPARMESVLPESEREYTQGYTDLKDDVLSGLQESDSRELSFEEQLASIRTERQIRAERPATSEYDAPVYSDYAQEEAKLEESEGAFDRVLNSMKNSYEEPKYIEPENVVASSDEFASVQSPGEYVPADRPRRAPQSPQRSVGRDTMYREYQDSFTSIDNIDEPKTTDDEYVNIRLQNLNDTINNNELTGFTNKTPDPETAPIFGGGEIDIPSANSIREESEDVNVDDVFSSFPSSSADRMDVENDYDEFGEYLDYISPGRASRSSRRSRAMAEEEGWFETGDELDDESVMDEINLTVPEDEPEEEPQVAEAASEAVAAEESPAENAEVSAEVVAPTDAANEAAEGAADAIAAEAPAAEEAGLQGEIASLRKTLELVLSQNGVGTPEVENEEAAEVAPEVPESEEAAEDAFAEPEVDTLEMDEIASEESSFGGSDELDLDKELASLGFYLGDDDAVAEEPQVEDYSFNTSDVDSLDILDNVSDTTVLPTDELQGSDYEEDSLSLENLENDIFGGVAEEDLETTRKIDKFYTLYRKNEEFQRLLDEEYNKLQGGDIDDGYTDSVDSLMEFENEGPSQPTEFEDSFSNLNSFDAAPQNAFQQAMPQQDAFQQMPQQAAPLSQAAPAPMDNSQLFEQANEASKEDSRKKVKKKKKEKEEYDEKGGNLLTVIAIVVAVLLVVLLGIILILNFAPESGIAQTLNEVIGNYTNFFADGGGTDTLL